MLEKEYLKKKILLFLVMFETLENYVSDLNDNIKDTYKTRLEAITLLRILINYSWNLIKDYLFYLGEIETEIPREVIRKALSKNIITNRDIWFDMLNKDDMFDNLEYYEYVKRILKYLKKKYIHEFRNTYQFFKKLDEEF